jgi:hypothetical protein
MAAPTVADPGNHVYCRIVTVRGAIASGNPWEVVAGGTKGTASTSVSMAAVTTTIQNTLIVHAVTHNIDNAGAQFSNVANANLSGLSEDADAGTTSGNGGGFAVWDGVLSTPGSTGNTTATVGSSVNAFVTLAIVPGTPRIGVPPGTQIGDLMVASIVVRPSTTVILPPSGWTAETPTVQAAANSSRQRIFWRVADATDAGGGVTYQWAFDSSSTGAAGAIVSYSGVDTISASPLDVIAGNTTASATTHTATAVTTTVPNTMVISSHAFASSETWTPPLGMTEQIDISTETPSNTAGISLEVNEVIQGSAGTTGNKTATAVGNADAGTAQILALRPAYTHYSVSYPNGTSYATCEPAVIRIEAHHVGHGLAAPPLGTVMNIVTSTASGVWQSPTVTGSGTWSPSGSNNGAATYTWPGNEAVLEVRLRHNVATTLNLDLTETPPGKTEGGGSEDPTLTFATTVLRVTDASAASAVNIATQVAAKASDSNGLGTGTPAYYVQGVATATNNTCQTLFRNQTISIDFAMQCNSPTNCATTVDTFDVKNSGGTFTSIQKSSAAPGTYTAVSLAFDNTADAKAALVFRYNDAGQATLHMRYTLPSPPASSTITGTSNAFVTRPFGLAFHGANTATPVGHGVDDTSTVLVPAGDVFTITIAAYKWASAEDDGTGNPLPAANITDNGITPSFTAPVTVAVNTVPTVPPLPLGNLAGVAGSIQRGAGCASPPTIAASEFLSAGVPTGIATVTDWCYTEVGNVFLLATATDYISSGVTVTGNSGLDDTTGTNGHVGRFRPKQFALSAGSITNRAALSCASTFSYLGERLDLVFTLTAQNTQANTTQNYAGSYAKLGLATTDDLSVFSLGARSGGTNLTTRLSTGAGTASSGSWNNGVAANVTIQTAVQRAASPDGPYTATAFGIAPSNEGVAMSAFNLDVDGAGGDDHTSLGATSELRFGRLRVQNALASSGAITLPVPIETQYWNGSAFVRNTLDGCTTLARANFTLSSYTLNLNACETRVSQASVSFTGGTGTMSLAAPGVANNGLVLITPNLGSTASGNYCDTVGGAELAATAANQSYLQGAWSGATYDSNPSLRAAWGLFGSQPQNFIYQRENY